MEPDAIVVSLTPEQLHVVRDALDLWHDMIEDDVASGGVGDVGLVAAAQDEFMRAVRAWGAC